MASFTIRVELQGSPTAKQYESLHQSMAVLGFQRSIAGVRSGNAVTVNLPTGLYYGDSNQAALDVSQTVYNVASTIQPVASVFVAQTSTWACNP